jgi:hypothetical protein
MAWHFSMLPAIVAFEPKLSVRSIVTRCPLDYRPEQSDFPKEQAALSP